MTRSFTDNINSFNVSNVLNVSTHYAAAEDRSEILTWLSPLEPRIRHQDLRTRRADNVGEWLLETEEFQRWYDGSQQTVSERLCSAAAVRLSARPISGERKFSKEMKGDANEQRYQFTRGRQVMR